MVKIATILTVRNGSSRLPRKNTRAICGKPVMVWTIERLSKLPGKVIVATTDKQEDNSIADICTSIDIPVFRGAVDDVVGRMNGALMQYIPDADLVFRGLGDCPFIEIELVNRAAQIIHSTESDAFLWHLSPDTWPVYGSREFPFSINGWKKIFNKATGEEREHIDEYYHNNREKFKIVYHEPPSTIYFRPYRLEIDWFEDLDLIDTIGKEIGMESTLSDVIKFLDENPQIASINKDRTEKTGPLTSYIYGLRRKWMRAMIGKPVTAWDNTVWQPPDPKATPIFCNSGKCLIGYGKSGILYTKSGDRIGGNAYKSCPCGAGKYWKAAIEKAK